jgi:hypothetical protein
MGMGTGEKRNGGQAKKKTTERQIQSQREKKTISITTESKSTKQGRVASQESTAIQSESATAISSIARLCGEKQTAKSEN